MTYGTERKNTKLTEEDIPKIREMLKNGKTRGQVAIRFKVHNATIQGIAEGWTWKHVK